MWTGLEGRCVLLGLLVRASAGQRPSLALPCLPFFLFFFSFFSFVSFSTLLPLLLPFPHTTPSASARLAGLGPSRGIPLLALSYFCSAPLPTLFPFSFSLCFSSSLPSLLVLPPCLFMPPLSCKFSGATAMCLCPVCNKRFGKKPSSRSLSHRGPSRRGEGGEGDQEERKGKKKIK